jgi:hypothetical protein
LSPMGRNHDRQPLREDASGTIRRPTIKTMRPQTDSHRRTVARKIAQRAAISTVNVSGMNSTPWTGTTNGSGRDDHHHDAALPKHVIQRQSRWIGQAQRQRAGGGSHLPFQLKTFRLICVLSRDAGQRSTKSAEDPPENRPTR